MYEVYHETSLLSRAISQKRLTFSKDDFPAIENCRALAVRGFLGQHLQENGVASVNMEKFLPKPAERAMITGKLSRVRPQRGDDTAGGPAVCAEVICILVGSDARNGYIGRTVGRLKS